MSGQLYQVMPPLDEAEYEALKASIAAGYDPARPVVVDEQGNVLDGHHRRRVCAELGIEAPTVVLPGLTEDQKHDYAMRANLACRHLSQAQKRDLIRAELERDPGRSDREVGRLVGCDHKTVGMVRRGEIPRPRPQLSRAEAEQATANIGRWLAEWDRSMMVALMAGLPSAHVLRQFVGESERGVAKIRASCGDEAAGAVWDVIVCSRIEALAAWPHAGAIADGILSQDDELKALYTERLAAGVLT